MPAPERLYEAAPAKRPLVAGLAIPSLDRSEAAQRSASLVLAPRSGDVLRHRATRPIRPSSGSHGVSVYGQASGALHGCPEALNSGWAATSQPVHHLTCLTSCSQRVRHAAVTAACPGAVAPSRPTRPEPRAGT